MVRAFQYQWLLLTQSHIGRRFRHNTGWLMLGNVGSLALGFVTTAYLARALGQASFGQFSYAQTLAIYAALVVDLGLNSYGNRTVAKQPRAGGQLVLHIGLLQTAAGLVLLSLLASFIGYGWVWQSSEIRTLILISVCWVLPFALNIEWFFLGNQQTSVVGIARLLQQITFLGLALALVHGPQDVALAPVARLIGGLVSAAWLFARLPKGLLRQIRFEPGTFIAYLRSGRWFWWSALLLQLSRSCDVLLLQAFRSAPEVGLYSAGARLTALATVAIGLINTVMFSMLAREQVTNQQNYLQLERIFVVIASTIAGATLLVGLPGARLIITLIFGAAYQESVPIFRILLVAGALLVMQGAVEQPLLARGRERAVFVITAATAALNLLLNLLLIPRFGVLGAASVALGSAFFSFVAMLCFRWLCTDRRSSDDTHRLTSPEKI